MGLVRFRKDLSYSAFLALAEKDANTLYFINDTNRIFLGDKPYGGKDIFVEDSETVGLSFVDDTLEATAIISGEDGNSLEIRADGLHAPTPVFPRVEYPVDGELAGAYESIVEDCNLRIVEEINENSNDWMVPSVAAVYEAISKVSPDWDSETVDDSYLPDLPKRVWMDYTKKITANESSFQAKCSYLISNGKTVNFLITYILKWDNRDIEIWPLIFPQALAPKNTMYFAFSCCTAFDQEADPLMKKGGYVAIDTLGYVTAQSEYTFKPTGQYYVTIFGSYEI
ncbi:MAG: hypothetical protein LBC41_00010 [Clostridiales bacterium]|jgi:hypothetical protein|nr:hypothetical protein [Clostridiales bacterium]